MVWTLPFNSYLCHGVNNVVTYSDLPEGWSSDSRLQPEVLSRLRRQESELLAEEFNPVISYLALTSSKPCTVIITSVMD